MMRLIIGIISIILLMATVSFPATDTDSSETDQPRYQLGLRLGAWSNQGETPPASGLDGFFQSDINETSFYFEGQLSYRLFDQAVFELAIGSVNRGTVTLKDDQESRIGNLMVTPILLQAKFYPVPTHLSRLRPFVSAGGGLYFGRRTVQFVTLSNPYYNDLQGESRTVLGYTLAAGFDWVLGQSIGLEGMVRYLPVRFSDELALVEDYEAVAITIGIKYYRQDK